LRVSVWLSVYHPPSYTWAKRQKKAALIRRIVILKLDILNVIFLITVRYIRPGERLLSGLILTVSLTKLRKAYLLEQVQRCRALEIV
jgi:hypothetical protein